MKRLIILGVVALMGTSQMAFGAGDVGAGRLKYMQLCIACHGVSGAGDGAAAAAMKPKPKNLATSTLTDMKMFSVIKDGGSVNGLSPMMASWKTSLTDQEIHNVVAYIRSLKK